MLSRFRILAGRGGGADAGGSVQRVRHPLLADVTERAEASPVREAAPLRRPPLFTVDPRPRATPLGARRWWVDQLGGLDEARAVARAIWPQG